MGAIWPPSVCLTGVPEINIDNVFIYPNPTTGIVNFQFSTVSFQRISLKIYDLHGREVATVVDKMMPAGEHTVSFDAASLSAGVYVYKKTEVSSQKSEVGKLIKY
jgi:hypothetical protein